MVSSSIIYTIFFIMGCLLLLDSIHAKSVTTNQDHDDEILSIKKRAFEHDNEFPDEYQGIMLGKHKFAARAVRLPSESILLGKRRLPAEAILLGRRNSYNDDILYNNRR